MVEATYHISNRFCFFAAKRSGCMVWHTSAVPLQSIPEGTPGFTVPTRHRKHDFLNFSIKHYEQASAPERTKNKRNSLIIKSHIFYSQHYIL
jgi:hypothetical protein